MQLFLRSNFYFCIFMYRDYLYRQRGVPVNAFRKKNLFGIDDVAIALGISALVGGVTSAVASSENNSLMEQLNEQNLMAVRETNEANRQMTKETNLVNAAIAANYNANQVDLQNSMNRYNYGMWKLNNDYNEKYNSPTAILERAKNAGINPNSAMGYNTAANASPVQQTALPQQMMPKYETSKDMPAKKELHKDFSFIKELGQQIADLPFNKERIESMRLANRQQKIQNDIAKFDLAEKENEAHMFNNFSFFRSTDGKEFIPADEFEGLSDSEKEKFLSPSSYRHVISDKLITKEQYDQLSDSLKDLYKPDYKDAMPEVVKLPFRSRKAFEDWKALQAVPATLSNIRADNLQNKLREMVNSGQLKDNDTVKALVDMPKFAFKKLQKEVTKIDKEIEYDMKVNENLSDRLKSQDDIARFTAKKLENELNKDFITIIEQHLPDGGLRDFLIGAYAFLKSFR